MRFDVITLFPEFFESPLKSGLIAKALDKNIADVYFTNPRDFTTDKHRKVDDIPFGGGVGMVLKPEPLFLAIESLPILPKREVIYVTPQGEPLQQNHFQAWASEYEQLVILCGHYEGIDERVVETLVTQEISLGDFVLTCGEIPALTILNGVIRLLPGTVGKTDSLIQDSFSAGLLDYPHYTRPATFRDLEVPPVLLSGHHGEIQKWRTQQQLQRTQTRRPDLYAQWQQQQQ